MTAVLDACAIIAFFRNAPGADVVRIYILSPEQECAVHVINLCEVYCDFLRSSDEATAQRILNELREAGVFFRADIDQDFWQAAGRYKAAIRRISLADCFAIACDEPLGGQVAHFRPAGIRSGGKSRHLSSDIYQITGARLPHGTDFEVRGWICLLGALIFYQFA